VYSGLYPECKPRSAFETLPIYEVLWSGNISDISNYFSILTNFPQIGRISKYFPWFALGYVCTRAPPPPPPSVLSLYVVLGEALATQRGEGASLASSIT